MRFLIFAAVLCTSGLAGAADWTADELRTLRSLSLESLEPLPPDPSNNYADNRRAAALGERLFFDPRLSSNGAVSCASCHQPDRAFTDGVPLAVGVGTADRHTPTLIGVSYSPWHFWDGRKDSQWSQALGPLEAAVEHGGTRTQYVKLVLSDPEYRQAYEDIFGPIPADFEFESLPDQAMPGGSDQVRRNWLEMTTVAQERVSRVFANIGKAIAAYERRLMPQPARFDRYVSAIDQGKKVAKADALTGDEIAGLRLFIGKGNCTQCHNGPLLTNNEFHNTGLSGDPNDRGRAEGIHAALRDEFNCKGSFSDAAEGECGELEFAKTDGEELVGAFKSPTLRNIEITAPYMHDGRFGTLRQVIDHYNEAPSGTAGRSELVRLNLSEAEKSQLEAFMRTLTGP